MRSGLAAPSASCTGSSIAARGSGGSASPRKVTLSPAAPGDSRVLEQLCKPVTDPIAVIQSGFFHPKPGTVGIALGRVGSVREVLSEVCAALELCSQENDA